MDSGERQGRREAMEKMVRQIRENNPQVSYGEAQSRAREAAIRKDHRDDKQRR